MPTNHRAHKYYDDESTVCETCKMADETEEHILKCESMGRNALRKTWLNEIEQYLSSSCMCDDIKYSIETGMKTWLGMQSRIRNVTSDLTRRAKREQDLPGWAQFLRGRSTITGGGESVNNHLHKRKITNITAEQWGVTLVSINWRYIIAFWLQRNEEQQGTTVFEKHTATKENQSQKSNYYNKRTKGYPIANGC
jgi:hypothetical protein